MGVVADVAYPSTMRVVEVELASWLGENLVFASGAQLAE